MVSINAFSPYDFTDWPTLPARKHGGIHDHRADPTLLCWGCRRYAVIESMREGDVSAIQPFRCVCIPFGARIGAVGPMLTNA